MPKSAVQWGQEGECGRASVGHGANTSSAGKLGLPVTVTHPDNLANCRFGQADKVVIGGGVRVVVRIEDLKPQELLLLEKIVHLHAATEARRVWFTTSQGGGMAHCFGQQHEHSRTGDALL
jgi:hypothetical protein